jgi:hypothetical protein
MVNTEFTEEIELEPGVRYMSVSMTWVFVISCTVVTVVRKVKDVKCCDTTTKDGFIYARGS